MPARPAASDSRVTAGTRCCKRSRASSVTMATRTPAMAALPTVSWKFLRTVEMAKFREKVSNATTARKILKRRQRAAPTARCRSAATGLSTLTNSVTLAVHRHCAQIHAKSAQPQRLRQLRQNAFLRLHGHQPGRALSSSWHRALRRVSASYGGGLWGSSPVFHLTPVPSPRQGEGSYAKGENKSVRNV